MIDFASMNDHQLLGGWLVYHSLRIAELEAILQWSRNSVENVIYQRHAYPAPFGPVVWLRLMQSPQAQKDSPEFVREARKRLVKAAAQVVSARKSYNRSIYEYDERQRVTAAIIIKLIERNMYPSYYEADTGSRYLSIERRSIRISDHPTTSSSDLVADIRIKAGMDIEAEAAEAADALIKAMSA